MLILVPTSQGIESGRSHPDEVFQVTQGVNERTGIEGEGTLVSTGQVNDAL